MADVVFVETTTGSAMFTKRKNDPDFRQGPAGFVIVNLSVLSHNPHHDIDAHNSDTNWQGCFVWLWRLILDLRC